MSPGTAIVVGAGPSGLGAATALGASMSVQLVDRIPVAGGEVGWRSRTIQDLVRRATERAVRFRLGATALRWDGRRLLIAAPGDIGWQDADLLVFAGGRRPGTAADLHLVGDRPSGVLAATVAEHLLSTNVPLWRAPLIVGAGSWARHICAQLAGLDISATALVRPDEPTPWAARRVETSGTVEVLGDDRVRAVRLLGEHDQPEITCDAVILNGRGVCNRNVDGALDEDAANVLFAQPLIEQSCEDRYRAAYDIAQRWLSTRGES